MIVANDISLNHPTTDILLDAPCPLRILGVFAHPDDETFCAGGTLAKYVAAGAEIMVVSATRGDAGQIRDARAATRRTLGQVRELELRRACDHLGVQHAVCLDYGDGTLKDIDQEVLTRHVTQIIRSFRPDMVITFGEDGAYGHPDHVAMSLATSAACARAGDPQHFPEQIAAGLLAHTPGCLYHSQFPRNRMLLLDRLVNWLVGHARRFCGTVDFARTLVCLSEAATVLGYTSDHVDVQWYPAGFSIVEQDEPATKLYFILSGKAEVIREQTDGTAQTLARLAPGAFFGEQGLAHQQPRNAHVVALENVTCLVFAPGEPTAFAGRGAGANEQLATVVGPGESALQQVTTTCIDVGAYVEQKIAAIAAHRTQYPIAPDMLPLAILQDMLGREYFVRGSPCVRNRERDVA